MAARLRIAEEDLRIAVEALKRIRAHSVYNAHQTATEALRRIVEHDAPALSAPPGSVRDTGRVRLGDGFISAEFPPMSRR
jgi:hypothetical protein